MTRTAVDTHHVRLGHLEGSGVEEICAVYDGTSERLVALEDVPKKVIGNPSGAT